MKVWRMCLGLILIGLIYSLSGCSLIKSTELPPAGSLTASPPAGSPVKLHLTGGKFLGSGQAQVTLSQAIKIALSHNPQISAARWDSRAAAARWESAASRRWPSLGIAGSYNHYLDNQRLIPTRYTGERGIFSNDIFIANLVLKMPLFTGGRIINEIRAAELERQVQEHSLERTRQELIFNVSSVFYSILGQRRVIGSLEFSQKALQEHRQRVLNLIEAKKAAKVDLLRTEVRLADLEQRLVQERNVMAIQRQLLTNLLGLDSKELVSPQGQLTQQVAMEKERNYIRPDYASASAALKAQARLLDSARARRWPTLWLQGSYGEKYAAGAGQGSDALEDVGSLGLSLDVPIFEGGGISARIHQESAKLAAAQERLRKLDLQIHLEIETATLKVTSAKKRVEATQKAIEQATESLRIEREKYELSKGSNTEVLDAQSALLEAQTNYYRSLVEYNTSIAQLHLAKGRRN